jgi:hypothetical protein
MTLAKRSVRVSDSRPVLALVLLQVSDSCPVLALVLPQASESVSELGWESAWWEWELASVSEWELASVSELELVLG